MPLWAVADVTCMHFVEVNPIHFSGKVELGKQQLPARGKIILLANKTRETGWLIYIHSGQSLNRIGRDSYDATHAFLGLQYTCMSLYMTLYIHTS